MSPPGHRDTDATSRSRRRRPGANRRPPRRLWPLIQSQAECAKAVWRNADQGIWEARGKPQHYVSSKLMCWVAMDRAEKLAEIRGDGQIAAGWAETAAEIKADILAHGVDKRGVLCQHYDTESLDASTLLAAIFGFLRADDPRLEASVLAIADELTENELVLRYRTDETDDGLSGKEGTFVICSFWLVSALAIVGEMQRARDLMERLVKVASPARPLRRGVRRGELQTSRQFPPGVFPSRRGRGGGASRPCRPDGGDNGMTGTCDVIVIGSGAGGGTLVRQLAASGKRGRGAAARVVRRTAAADRASPGVARGATHRQRADRRCLLGGPRRACC